MKILTAFALATAVAISGACGSATTTADAARTDAPTSIDSHEVIDGPIAIDGATHDAPNATDGSAMPDGSPTIDAHPTASDATPAGVYEGYVVLDESNGGAIGAQAQSAALFVNGSVWGPTLGASGECTLYGSPPMSGGSAGTVTITGAKSPISQIPSGTAPGATYATSPMTLPADVFDPGNTITYTASGGPDIPAFSGTVSAPTKLVGFTSPASLSRSGSAAMTWTASTGGAFWIWIFGFDSASNVNLLFCRTTDSGSYTVPPSAMALMPTADTMGITVGWRVDETNVPVGASLVHLWALDGVQSNVLTIGP